MKYFSTSEVDALVGDKIRPVRNTIEEKIRVVLEKKEYGSGVTYWGYIIICMAPEGYEGGMFREVKKYKERDKEVEMRLRVGYESVLNADENEVFRIICNSILRSIDIAENELCVEDFDFSSFRNDITTLFKDKGWL